VIENVPASPGKIATFTQPRSPATSPAEPAGARLLRLLARQRRPDRGEPGGSGRASAERVDDEARGDRRPVVEPHPDHPRAAAVGGRRDEPGHADPLAELDVRPRAHALAQRPLEGRAAAGEQHDVLVVGARRERHPGRCRLGERDLAHARRAQPLEDLGHVREEHEPDAGEEGVRVAELRHAAALPARERLLRAGDLRADVALEDHDAREVAGEQARGGEPGDAAAQDHRRRGLRCGPGRGGHGPSAARPIARLVAPGAGGRKRVASLAERSSA
jgi:hypothetical protein